MSGMLHNTTSLQTEVQHPKKLHFLQNNSFLAIIKGITVTRRSTKKLYQGDLQRNYMSNSTAAECY
jgi:hypothetical protein